MNEVVDDRGKLVLERLSVRGTARDMGRAQGEAFRERVHRFMEIRFAALQVYALDRGRATPEGILDIARQSMAVHEGWDPEGYSEHLGIAEGAAVDPVDLYAITNMTDMRDVLLLGDPSAWRVLPDAEGCTSVMVPASHARGGQVLAGQSWDLNPTDVDFVVAVHRRPTGAPETWSVTCTGCLSLVGMNAEGLMVGTTNIKTHGARPGVGYLGVLHRALSERDARSASERVAGAPVAGAHTYWMSDGEAQIEWEASPDRRHRRDTSEGPVCRTNHCLFEDHVAVQGEPASDSSRTRLDFMRGRLGSGGLDIEGLRGLFADRSQGVLSVNRYIEDDQGTATNAVVLGVPAERRLLACRGPADRGAWVELAFET